MPELKRLRSEIQENMSEKIRQMSGRVFHVVQDKVLFRYRITDSGRIVKDKVRREFRRRMTGDPDKKIRDAVLENKNIVQVRREMRKRVTGDPEKKIRDYMTEVPQVKFIDKVYFTFGVGCVVLTEYLALRHPTLFMQYYYLLMAFLANYVLCMGCLMLAIVVWQNSLVFHSLDKITSFLLHAFPPLTLHMYRWHLIPNNLIPENDSLSWAESFFFPMLLYVGWQLLYLFITEVLLGGVLARDPDKITSARWLVKDKKNGMHQLVVKICTKQGWMAKGEELDADTWKAKIIFMTSQLVYTVVTMLVVPFLYNNYLLSVLYIASIYMWCVWRGGTYYIEVFSERYKLQFIKDEPTQKKDSNADGHKSEESDNDEVFEDADLFSEIVTALSEGGYTVESVSVQSVHSSVQSVNNSSTTTSQIVNISSSSLSTSTEGIAKNENDVTEDKNETDKASEETIETVVFTETNADNGSDSSESSFVDIKKPENQDRLTDSE